MNIWHETTLGDLISGTSGSVKTGPFGTALKANEYSSWGVPIISVGEVGYGSLQLRKDTPRAPDEVTARLPEYVLNTGDIVFGRKGAVDRSAWVKPEENGWFLGSDGIRLRLPPSIHSRFISYQFRAEAARTWLLQHAAGSTMLSLNQKILERVPLLIPEFHEQQAIAEVLGALDDKIAANTKLAATSDELATALLLRETEGSPSETLSSIATLTMGSSPTGETLNESGDGTVFYQGVRDFGVRFPTNRIWTTSPSRMALRGDSLISVRAPVGRVNLANEDLCVGRGLASARSTDDRPATLFHLLKSSSYVWEPFEAEGTVFGSINSKQLAGIELPQVPSDKKWLLEKDLGTLEARISVALRENQTLAATRDALLPQLMSGKLRVKDAESLAAAAV